MHVLLIGASGMVGQAALAACRLDPRVTRVTALVRSPLGIGGGTVRELVCPDLFEIAGIAPELDTPDACLFCAGISAVGKSEPDYRRITFDLTLAVATCLVGLNPAMHFLYVSGLGTDPVGRPMWARVKGATESALTKLGFAGVALFRPGYIQPVKGVRSKVVWYNAIYTIVSPVYPLLKMIASNYVTDSDTLGRAMLAAVQPTALTAVYDPAYINRIGAVSRLWDT